MSKEKLVPRLRFEEFLGNKSWSKKELNEVALYRNGKAHENDIADEGSFIVVNSKFVSTNGSVKKYSNNQNEPLFKDEIAFVLSDVPNGRAIARTYLITKNNKYTLNQRIAGITPNQNTNSYFLYNLMNRNPYFLKFDDGVKQTNLSKADVNNFYSFYPVKEEQNKIGCFLKKIDEMIQLQQSKINKVKDIKSAYLSEMFPKEGEKYPKKRFEGFIEPWEQVQVQDLFKITRGHVLSATKVTEYPTKKMKYPVYSSQTKNNGLMGYYHKYLYQNAITWTTDGANAGTVSYRPSKFYCTNVSGVLISNEGYANRMIAEALNQIAWKHVSKVGNPKLMNNIMAEITVTIPQSIKEQHKIAEFIRKIDNQISIEEEKLTKLEKLKQGYLNDMFI